MQDNVYVEILSVAKLFSSATLVSVITAAVRCWKKKFAYFLRNIYIQISTILRATLGRPRGSDTRVRIRVRVEACARASRRTDEPNCSVGSAARKMVRQREWRDACESTKIPEIV